MRIEKIGPDPGGSRVARAEGLRPSYSAFQDRLQRVGDSALRGELTALIAEVEDRGRRLLSSRSRSEFEAYKESVRRFVNRAVAGSFAVEERQVQRRDGKFVVYLLTRRVDEALENLAQLLWAGQQDIFRIVSMLDEIRGILMDFYI